MANVTIYGRLTRDPELKEVGSSKVAKFAVADGDRFYNGKGAEPQPLFHECEVWGGQAGVVADYARKGQRIVVFGQLCPNNYTNKDGQQVKATIVKVDRVDLVETKGESESAGSRYQGGGYGNAPADDEIPF